MKKQLYPLMLATLFATGAAAQAQSTTTYDWTVTGSSYGNGSGTLTVDDASDLGPDYNYYLFAGDGYDYTILSLTGTFDGVTITKDPGGPDELNFSSATLPGATLEGEEMSILDGSTEYLIANVNGDSTSPAAVYKNHGASGADAKNDVFTVVPEPGSLALAAVGGLGLLVWRTRRAPGLRQN